MEADARAEGVRAAGYVRVSQQRNVGRYGLGAQEVDVRRHAEYMRWELVETYREEGVSGYKRERPALGRMTADAEAGRFNVAVFPSLDRIARSVKDSIEIEKRFRDCGVSVVFVRENIDTGTAVGEFFRNVMSSIAEFEGHLMHERMGREEDIRVASGRPVTPPDGEGAERHGRPDAARQEVASVGRLGDIPEPFLHRQVEGRRRLGRWPAQSGCLRRAFQEGQCSQPQGRLRTVGLLRLASSLRSVLPSRFTNDLLDAPPAEMDAPRDLVRGQAFLVKSQDIVSAALVELPVRGEVDEAGAKLADPLHELRRQYIFGVDVPHDHGGSSIITRCLRRPPYAFSSARA